MTRMSNEQIKNLTQNDINNMTKSELARVTTDLQAIAKKRYNRLVAKGLNTPAVRGIEKAGGFNSLKNMTLDQIRAEFNKANTFTNKAKTSSVAGANKVHKEMLNRMGNDGYTKDQIKDFWDVYHKLEELNPDLTNSKRGSPYALSEINILMNEGLSVDDMVAAVHKKLTGYYEMLEQQEREHEDEEFSIQFANGLPFTF